MRKKQWIQVIVVDSILLALALIVSNIDKTDLIISVGLKAANFLLSAGKIIAWILLAVFNGVSLVRLWKTRPPKAIPTAQDEPKKPWQIRISDPKEIRQELLSMQEKRPPLEELLGCALEQMDSLYRNRARLDDVLRRDILVYGEHAIKAIQDAEKVLCNNFVKIMNYADLCDPMEKSIAHMSRQERHKEKMTVLLSQNAEVLDKCGELISKTVQYGDGKAEFPDAEALGIITSLDALGYLLAKTGRDYE